MASLCQEGQRGLLVVLRPQVQMWLLGSADKQAALWDRKVLKVLGSGHRLLKVHATESPALLPACASSKRTGDKQPTDCSLVPPHCALRPFWLLSTSNCTSTQPCRDINPSKHTPPPSTSAAVQDSCTVCTLTAYAVLSYCFV